MAPTLKESVVPPSITAGIAGEELSVITGAFPPGASKEKFKNELESQKT